MAEYINREALLERLKFKRDNGDLNRQKYSGLESAIAQVKKSPVADVVEVEKVAEMLRRMFDDDCACNYNGNDEWLPMKCKYANTECPTPKEQLACWKEFVKYFLKKMNEKED